MAFLINRSTLRLLTLLDQMRTLGLKVSKRNKRAAFVFLICGLFWTFVLAIPVAEAHGYFDCQAMRCKPVGYLAVGMFPFILSGLGESIGTLLTLAHWTLVFGLFTALPDSLSFGKAVMVGLIAMPLLGFSVWALLYTLGWASLL